VAIWFQTICSILIVAVVAVAWNATAAFGFISFLEGLAASVAFILIMVAAIAYFRRTRPGDGAWRNYVIPLVGIVILVPAVYTAFYPNPGPPLNIAPYVMVAWLILGGAYLFWRETRNQEIDIDYAFREIGETPPSPDGEG
jgi:amino acid transporter